MKKQIIFALLLATAVLLFQPAAKDGQIAVGGTRSGHQCPPLCAPQEMRHNWHIHVSPARVVELEYNSDTFHFSVGLGHVGASQ